MSQENVEVIRRSIARLNESWELDPECYERDVEYTTQPDGPNLTTYEGIDGLRRSLASLGEVWDSVTTELLGFIEQDDVVVALLHFQLRGHSGVELEVDQGWVYWMRDGKIGRIQQHGSKQEALDAVGLSE